MNYGQIYFTDTANGIGCRTSLFVSGCSRHCRECFNPETWDFNYGEFFSKDVEDEVVESVKPPYIDGLSILGGEPMEIRNQEAVAHLVHRIKNEAPGATIWLYSGFTWEELSNPSSACRTEFTDSILSTIDVLVDGAFEIDKKDISLMFRGSSNQRIIDVPETIKKGHIVISEYNK
ncbi:MAG: anaerobic ribonucleoside-triphosphate reductase activating protein [Eubacteriales bacterium]|nr:anaerobic ribonucleoside-triphosphate reductase activating protein [Eubacteriales bacterium]